jgi:signal transduction histidine kinase/CheY-like chemotaxis protein
MWLVIAAGVPACLYAAFNLPVARLDLRFGLLALLTTMVGSRVGVEIPHVGGRITVADTLIFLTLMLYGGEAAVLLATAETVLNSRRVSRKPITTFFNMSMMAASTTLTVAVLSVAFGPINFQNGALSNAIFFGVVLMALVQYVTNSVLVAVAAALKNDEAIWQTWKKYYLWTSLTYIGGATIAVVIARAINTVGFYGVAATLPVVAIIYFTYQTYLKNIQASEAQAEQARRHVEELSRYIAEQERIREQFLQVEKMSALGVMASGVAHDFNNSLAAILGRAELLLKRAEDPKLRRGLEIIIKSAEDGAKTVKRIQDFARQRRDKNFELIDVDQMLLDVSEITRPRWKGRAEAESVPIDFELCNDSHVFISGDISELRDVLVNMIFNALDAMPAGGRLRLASERRGDKVVITIADTGTGMSPEVCERIFDPFFTTKGVSGMGLGLAVGYGVISRHEGTIVVTSEVGLGTTFRITLPIAVEATEERNAEHAGAAAEASPRRKNMTKILVVDDEERVRELLREMLEEDGFEVDLAGSGREGLALFEAKHYDAVFTDVGMPGMSGWELARAIRERDSQTPLAIITGWGEVVGSAERETAEVNWVLTKPFSMAQIGEIAQAVAEICQGSPGVPLYAA